MASPYVITPRNRIRKLRKIQGLSGAQLAQAVNVAPSTVSRWERGKQRVPAEAWHQLADIFGGAQLDYLMGRGEAE